MAKSYSPGSVDNFVLILSNFDGSRKVDISSLVLNMSITEDIFKNTLYGSVLIKDAIGILEGSSNGSDPKNSFPIIGEEFLDLTFKPHDQDEVKLRFFVYNVGDIMYNKSNKRKQYTLNFASEEHLVDSTTIVMKSYNAPHSDNVQNILKDYLFIDKSDSPYRGKLKKTVDKVQPTRGSQSVIIPRLPPIQAAHFLARRSIAADKYNSGTYLFFENFKGFNFCDIEYLIEKGIDKFNSFGKYTSQTDVHPLLYRFEDPMVVSAREKNPTKREMNAIHHMHHKNFFDTIEKLKRGYLESDVIVYDYTKANLTPTRFRFLNNPDKTNNIEIALGGADGKSYPPNSTTLMNFGTSTTDTDVKYNRFFMIPKDTSKQDTYLDQIYPNRASYFTALAQNMFTIDTYGNTKVNAGDLIYVNIPSAKDGSLNEFISGFYLVCTIRHVITQSFYHTKMDIYKNAFDVQVKTTVDSSGANVSATTVQSTPSASSNTK